MVGAHSEKRDGLSEASLGLKTAQEAFNGTSYPSYSKDDFTHDTVADAKFLRNTDNFSRSHNDSSEMNVVYTVSCEPTENSFSPIHEPATTLFSSEQVSMPNEQLEVPKLVSSCSLVDSSKEAENTGHENAVHKNINEIFPVQKSPQPSTPDAVQQMKTAQNMQLPPRHDEHKSNHMKQKKDDESGNEVSHPAKKARLEEQDQEMNLIGNSSVSSTLSHTTISADKVGNTSGSVRQHKIVHDIMSIVEGDDYIRDPGREQAKPVGRRAGEKPGLRVKKIFRKEGGKESSVTVQKLQQEIREVVRDTGTNILEKDGSFDEKLLTAFRAAIGKSTDGPAKNTNNSLIRARRSLLQKGKKRENLTKKLYGTSTGRRRSEWHRDWEVEFWKYRCSPGINPEKVETLQSVLQLLKKSSQMDKENAQGKMGESNSSILSRLYLADASVVPRKDDIKPLSALSGCAPLDKNGQTKANTSKFPNKPAAGTEAIKIISPSCIGKVSDSSVLNKEASCRREDRNSQEPSQKNQSAGNIKHDKRQWALDILARKNASSVTSKDQTGDTDALKGNFPLLAQLPADMRPQPAAGRNNKVPLSVRQAQQHRIAEHYLQNTNLDVIRRCADTELAVADAVNVEKNIYERSNSKLVYVNLCSQATRQASKAKSDNDAPTVTEKAELDSDPMSQQVTSETTNVSGSDMEEDLSRAVVSDQRSKLDNDIVPEQAVRKHTLSFSSAEQALREAGLFDSPPNSSERESTTVDGEGSHSCTVDLDSEPSRILQSSPDSRLNDVSSLKEADSSVMSTEEPKANSEEHQKLIPSEQSNDATTNETDAMNLVEADRNGPQCEKSSGPNKETVVGCNMPDQITGHVNSSDMEKAASSLPNQSPHGNDLAKEGELISKPNNLVPSKEKSSDNPLPDNKHTKGDKPSHPIQVGDDSKKPATDQSNKHTSDSSSSIHKKVEMYVKEHVRPLCKSGVITVDQYRWAVAKTTDKVMSFHRDAKNANFLIKEGDKVKKLALQYVEAAHQKFN